jgi:spermidine synthase
MTAREVNGWPDGSIDDRDSVVSDVVRYRHLLITLFFLLSGATGLIYEIIWFKRFTYLWGSSTVAMAVVVSSFLGGLGLGAYLLGRIADRIQSQLRWYGFLEIGLGLLALLITWETSGVRLINGLIGGFAAGDVLGQTLLRFSLTFLVIGPPCILMGGTLPLLVRYVSNVSGPRGGAVGWLYGVNTLGAAFGCLLAGFFILPALGLLWTNLVTVLTNILVGTAAIVTDRMLPLPPNSGRARTDAATLPVSWSVVRGCLAVGLTGWAAIMLQMIWARQLSSTVGGSTYAFTATLFSVLLGIGAGSLAYRLVHDRVSTWWLLFIAAATLGIFTVLGKLSIPALCEIAGELRDLRGSYTFNATVCVLVASVIQLVPCLVMGFLFPLIVEYTQRSSERVGRIVGTLYASNVAGSILGGLLTYAIVVPQVGSDAAIAAAIGMYFVGLALLSPLRTRPDRLKIAAILGCGVALGLWCATTIPDPIDTNYGNFLYGMLPVTDMQTLSYEEGRFANVLVSEHKDNIMLRINGKIDASNRGDMRTQLGLAFLPLFLKPDPESILVIGYGSGTTTGAAASLTRARVTCCEIEPAVVEAGRFFERANYQVNSSPLVTFVYDDARNMLQSATTKYDVILSAPSNPWMAGLANLFTREFYETVRGTLHTNGLLAQWIQLYSLSPAEYRMVVRTVREVFPHAGIIQTTAGDTIMLASSQPLDVSPADLDTIQGQVDGNAQVTKDLREYFGATDVRSLLLEHYILGHNEVDTLVAGDHATYLNTDANMRLEFDAPLHLFGQDVTVADTVTNLLNSAMDPSWFRRCFRAWGCGRPQLPALRKVIERFSGQGNGVAVGELCRFALTVDPQDPYFLTAAIVNRPDSNSQAWLAEIDKLARMSPVHVNRISLQFWNTGKRELAVTVLEHLVSVHPESATAWANLGVAYRRLGQDEQAERALRRAYELDPVNEFVVKSASNE